MSVKNLIKIIGDVHGKTGDYKRIIRSLDWDQRSIQIGDMGLGFQGVVLHEMGDEHKFFRGNHDDPKMCRASKHYLGDYGYLPEDDLFYIAGAYSIDRVYKTPMVSWWPDEELSYAELSAAIKLYKEVKPRFVVSHEAPAAAGRTMLQGVLLGNNSIDKDMYFDAKLDCCNSRTSVALQEMFDCYNPQEWVFGHYHVWKDFIIGTTRFQCVPELGVYDLHTRRKDGV